MKLGCMVMAAVAATTSLGASADDGLNGQVQSVYVRKANGVMLDQRIASGAGERWAEVRLAAPGADGREYAIARIGSAGSVRTGDQVSLRRNELPGLAAETRVVAVAER